MSRSVDGPSVVGLWRIAALAVAGAVLVGCSSAPPPPPAATPPPTLPPSVVATSPAPTIQPVTATDLGSTWRPGCPIDPQQLRRVEVGFVGFDGRSHRAPLIVNEDVAPDVVVIFKRLVELRYPIEKIRTADS